MHLLRLKPESWLGCVLSSAWRLASSLHRESGRRRQRRRRLGTRLLPSTVPEPLPGTSRLGSMGAVGAEGRGSAKRASAVARHLTRLPLRKASFFCQTAPWLPSQWSGRNGDARRLRHGCTVTAASQPMHVHVRRSAVFRRTIETKGLGSLMCQVSPDRLVRLERQGRHLCSRSLSPAARTRAQNSSPLTRVAGQPWAACLLCCFHASARSSWGFT